MTATIGGPAEVLADAAVAAFVAEQFAALDLDGRSLCLVIPTPPATARCHSSSARSCGRSRGGSARARRSWPSASGGSGARACGRPA